MSSVIRSGWKVISIIDFENRGILGNEATNKKETTKQFEKTMNKPWWTRYRWQY